LGGDNDAVNPIRALRRSASILKKTWGETIIGYAGLAFGNAIIAFSNVLLLVSCVVYGFAMNTAWLPVSVAAAWIALLIVYSYVIGVASRIYLGALYIYFFRDLSLAVDFDDAARSALGDENTAVTQRLAGVDFNFVGSFVFPNGLFVRSQFTRARAVADEIVSIVETPTILWIRAGEFPFAFPLA
jgi:hypothetical protein